MNAKSFSAGVTIDINERIDMTKDFYVDGIFVPITGWIEFDATLDFVDDEAMNLHPRSGIGRYSIYDYEFIEGVLDDTEQTRLTGSYSLSGPTETVEGTFSINPEWSRLGSGVLDLSDTNRVVLDSLPGKSMAWQVDHLTLLFGEPEVDGVGINARFEWADFYRPRELIFTIPEPSYAFAAVSLFVFVAFRRMIFILKSS